MARDTIHHVVRKALEKEGWKITADPYVLRISGGWFYMDLAAENVVAAERNGEKIAVEIKSLKGKSIFYAFYPALGKYLLYRDALTEQGVKRELYLATISDAWEKLQLNEFLKNRINQYQMKFLVVDEEEKIIVKWTK